MTERAERRLDDGLRRGASADIEVDGCPVRAFGGESIAAAMLAAGLRTCRTTSGDGAPRGLYCGIGLCHDCVMTVDGRSNVRTCRTEVRAGMRVRTQRAFGETPGAPEPQRAGGEASGFADPERERELVIVGAGPAGLAAAAEAARAGVACTIVDESARLGGQIYRQPPSAFADEPGAAKDAALRRGDLLRAEVEALRARIEIVGGTDVVGIWGRTLLLGLPDGTSAELRAKRVVLATGARDRPIPFPGWTLPGVLTAGGAQGFLKAMHVRPGERALVAGTGPLLLVVANQLHRAGVRVVAVLEAGRPRFTLGAAWRVRREVGLLADAWRYWRGLRRAKIPLLFHHTVFAAHGAGGVERATYGPVSPETWAPRREAAIDVDVDLVVAGFGFVPNVELASLAGCSLEHRDALGGWVPTRDPWTRTSVEGIYAAGDGSGVAGSLVAEEEGRVTGIAAALDLGRISAEEARRRARRPFRRVRSLGRARSVLDEVSRIRPGLLAALDPDTIVCRCEEVRASAVERAIAEGARDLQGVKLFTRLGMGACQGRNCEPSVAACVAAKTGRSPADVGRIEARPPVRAVTLGALARRRAAPSAAAEAPR